jgi:response regulator of citrate/malate metabolism
VKTAEERARARAETRREIAAAYAAAIDEPVVKAEQQRMLDQLTALGQERERIAQETMSLREESYNAVRMAAEDLDMPVQTIAEAVGLSKAQVWNYLNGKKDFYADRVRPPQ